MPPGNLYRLTSEDLMHTLENWDSLMSSRVHLIACGGTALTLLNIKESTKDIDFTVPIENEYKKLIKFLNDIGYIEGGGGLQHPDDPNFIYQFWEGDYVFTTQLLDPVLNTGMHIPIQKWSRIYLGVLNLIDLIVTKIIRGTSADMSDCMAAFETGKVDQDSLLERYSAAAEYDLNPKETMLNFYYFAEKLLEKQLVDNQYFESAKLILDEFRARP